MHLDNDWYGHRRTLADYCRTGNRPIFATLLHGWFWEFKPGRGQRRITSAPYLMWNRRQMDQARFNEVPNAPSIGAPFLYLHKLRGEESCHGAGTVFFPQHYTDHIYNHTPHQELIRLVEKDFPGPYTVSIFYSEPEFDKIKTLYSEAGWQVFCAGARSNPEFLNNLYGCISSHSQLVSNCLSTSILYAAYLGRSVRVLSDYLWDRDAISSLRSSDSDYCRLTDALFSGLAGDEARSVGARELGAELVLSPADLKLLLGWDSIWRSAAAQIVSWLVDVKYGRAIRRGERDL